MADDWEDLPFMNGPEAAEALQRIGAPPDDDDLIGIYANAATRDNYPVMDALLASGARMSQASQDELLFHFMGNDAFPLGAAAWLLDHGADPTHATMATMKTVGGCNVLRDVIKHGPDRLEAMLAKLTPAQTLAVLDLADARDGLTPLQFAHATTADPRTVALLTDARRWALGPDITFVADIATILANGPSAVDEPDLSELLGSLTVETAAARKAPKFIDPAGRLRAKTRTGERQRAHDARAKAADTRRHCIATKGTALCGDAMCRSECLVNFGRTGAKLVNGSRAADASAVRFQCAERHLQFKRAGDGAFEASLRLEDAMTTEKLDTWRDSMPESWSPVVVGDAVHFRVPAPLRAADMDALAEHFIGRCNRVTVTIGVMSKGDPRMTHGNMDVRTGVVEELWTFGTE
jgi:hypothetical protein